VPGEGLSKGFASDQWHLSSRSVCPHKASGMIFDLLMQWKIVNLHILWKCLFLPLVRWWQVRWPVAVAENLCLEEYNTDECR